MNHDDPAQQVDITIHPDGTSTEQPYALTAAEKLEDCR